MMKYHKRANYFIHVIRKFEEEANDLTKIVEEFHKFIQIRKIQPDLNNFFAIFFAGITCSSKSLT